MQKWIIYRLSTEFSLGVKPAIKYSTRDKNGSYHIAYHPIYEFRNHEIVLNQPVPAGWDIKFELFHFGRFKGKIRIKFKEY